jgi:hypothetical protein
MEGFDDPIEHYGQAQRHGKGVIEVLFEQFYGTICLFMTILHDFPVAALLWANVFQLPRLGQFGAGPFDCAQRLADSRCHCHLSQGHGRFFSQELKNSARVFTSVSTRVFTSSSRSSSSASREMGDTVRIKLAVLSLKSPTLTDLG